MAEQPDQPNIPKEMLVRERALREKMRRGEALTREEAGFLGGIGAVRDAPGTREEEKATREGVMDRRGPNVVREKLQRGEPLTLEEAGRLGGAPREERVGRDHE